MDTVIVYNKGKRNFNKIKGADGQFHTLEREGFLEMEQVAGLTLCKDYPQDLTTSKQSGPSTEDMRRREQSLKDREKAMAEKEAALDEREKAIEAREKAMAEHRKPGRPPKAEAGKDDE